MPVKLFQPIQFRGLSLPNRIVVAPMTQFSAPGGIAGDWHFVHLGQFAASGVGLVLTESTYVCRDGRNTLNCLGLYSDKQENSFKNIGQYFSATGNTVLGVQLCHAGRKASCRDPWDGGGPLLEKDGGFSASAPSAIAIDKDWPAPTELTKTAISDIIASFAESSIRAVRAGARLIELHGAHVI